MSDMRNIDRENKKKQLRSNIVPMPGNRSGSQTGGGTGHMAGGQSDPKEFDGDEMITRYRRKKFLRVFLVLFILAAALFIGYRYIYQHEFTDYSVRWEKPMRYVDGGLENGAGTKETAGGPKMETRIPIRIQKIRLPKERVRIPREKVWRLAAQWSPQGREASLSSTFPLAKI